MAYSIYSKAGTDEAISSALADSLPTTPADIGAATAAQGVLADATTVEQVTLTAPLALTVPAGFPAGQVYRVVLTQDGTGGHTVTYGGSPVTVDTTAGASTLVELWPDGSIVYPEMATAAPGRWEASAHGVAYDGTDQTAEFRALLDTVAAAGGGVIELGGLVRIDGQIVMPSTVVGAQVRQAPIRITGTAANMPGSTFTASSWAGSPGLDLRYAGRTDTNCATVLGSAVVLNAAAVAGDRGQIVTGPGLPDQAWILAVEPGVSWTLSRAARATGTVSLTSFGGRLQALAYGMLELDHLQFVSGAATSAPFVLTTGVTVKAHHNLFFGSGGKAGATCDEDPFVLGGPGQGTALTSALTSGQSYSALAVDALPVGIIAGATLVLNYGCPTTQSVTVPAEVAAGATSIPVTTFTANANYPARTGAYIGGWQKQESAGAWSVPSSPFQGYGTHISDNHFHACRRISVGGFATDVWIDNNAWMHNCGSNLAAMASTLTTQITAGATVTALVVTALAAPVNAGDVIQLAAGSVSQEFVASAAAAAGAVSVSVTSVTAAATFAVGTKAFNSTAGLGAAVESFALPGSVNTVHVKDNRIGMSGGYTHLTRWVGITMHSAITGNSWQDSHAKNLAAHRFDRGAQYNMVLTGMYNWAGALIDDWSSADHAQAQTLVTARQSEPARFPQGVRLSKTTTIERTLNGSITFADSAGLNLFTSAGALRTWFIEAPVVIAGNERGAATCALTIGNNSTASDSLLTLNTKSGQTGGIQFKRAGANSWYLYDSSGAGLYVRDSVNSVQALEFWPGAGITGKATFAGKVIAGGSIKSQAVATASRPTASSAGAGAMVYDTTLSKPVWSDGTAWRDAMGTAV